jgi:cell surface protein SprA
MLPQGGVLEHPAWGYLKIPERNLKYLHKIDFASREVEIVSYYFNTRNRDSTALWSSYYQELASYTLDMYDLGFRRLWLNSLIGQEDGFGAEDGSYFDISLPVNLPSWMKDFGLDKPKLLLQGEMQVTLSGNAKMTNQNNKSTGNLLPSITLDADPRFLVLGTIGRYITVRIDNQGEFGVRNKLSVVYKEAEEGEFEDFILQEVHAGNISLDLAGTQLTGYSEKHQGLFGLKAKLKVGDVYITSIASQEGGSQEKFKLKSKSEETEFQILDKQFIPYRYFFLTQQDRKAYLDNKGTTRLKRPPSGLKVYRQTTRLETNVLENMSAVYYNVSGDSVYARNGLRLQEMRENEWEWDDEAGVIRIPSGNRNSLFAAIWGTDPSGSNGYVSNGAKVVLFKDDQYRKETDSLMLRNYYSVGITTANQSNYRLNMYNTERQPGEYLRLLGLADEATGIVRRTDEKIFNPNTGDMRLPCLRAEDANVTEEVSRQFCLEPLRYLDTTEVFSRLYSEPAHRMNRLGSRFFFQAFGSRKQSSINVRDRSSYSVTSGGCMDIAPGTEKLKMGSVELRREIDYQVNYALGQIELISDRALDPNNEIDVTYECEPIFQIDNKMLLGTRADYEFRKFGKGSVAGLTTLFKTQSTTSEHPRFGGEPYASFLWGANIRLTDHANWMDKFINLLPFIDSEAKSNWTFEAELAQSWHNPNTSARASALLDDFESSRRTLSFPMNRTSWYFASPPGGVETDLTTFIPLLDYKHNGEFIWHSNQRERYRYIYPDANSSEVNNQLLRVLKFTLRPNDNLEGNSWGGVMRANSSFYQDMSTMKYIEVVARGNVGSLFVDFGKISEDISINGFAPNEVLNSEVEPGFSEPLHDYGLDGVTGKDEQIQKWDCRSEECVLIPFQADASDNDLARDNYREQEDDSDPTREINGTENNRSVEGGREYDTEDLDRDGTLDTEIEFVRYRIDLESALGYEQLKNGWKRYIIPINEFDTLISASNANYEEILGNVFTTRLWYGNLKQGVPEGQVQIVDFKVVGNQWEEASFDNTWDERENDVSQVVNVDGQIIEVTAPGAILERDSNYLNVRVINNRDDVGAYYKSPNTLKEYDQDTDAPLREQALVLKFGNLKPGQAVHATRFFDTEEKDLTLYNNMLMEIHLDSVPDPSQVPFVFAIQVGYGDLNGSENYYEWSYRPTAYTCADNQSKQECHNNNWEENAFKMALANWPEIKTNPEWRYPYLDRVEQDLPGAQAQERQEKIAIKGNPSISRVNWMRFVIRVDENHTSNQPVEGEIWINDLRLQGVNSDWGTAARSRVQLDFSDVMTLSGELNYKDGDFAPLTGGGQGSPKPTLAESNTELSTGAGLSFMLNKFFADDFKLKMPMLLGIQNSVYRPYVKPESDLQLSQDNYQDVLPDLLYGDLRNQSTADEWVLREEGESKGYQTFRQGRNFSVSYSKEYVKDDNYWADLVSQTFLERPSVRYLYRDEESRTALATDSSKNFNTVLNYNLGFFNHKPWRPFDFLGNQSWGKGMSRMVFSPWPQKFDMTMADFSYSKRMHRDRRLDDSVSLERIVDYDLQLNHGLKMDWQIFPFLTANYSLNINRDMDAFGDRPRFTRQKLLSSDEGAAQAIFDWDHTDRAYSIERSIGVHPAGIDPLRLDSAIFRIDSVETGVSTRYDTTWVYSYVELGDQEYGEDYGILRNERLRNQQFKLTFNPALVDFLSTRFAFGSNFTHRKNIPEDFEFNDVSTLNQNYWSVDQGNNFEFSPTLRLQNFFDLWSFTKPVNKFLKWWDWRELRWVWSVDLNTRGEEFSLMQLAEEQNMMPGDYYLYSFGLAQGNQGFRNPWNIFTGDMNFTDSTDYKRFGQYRNQHYDTLTYQYGFQHSVSRQWNLGSKVTVPYGKLDVTGNLYWNQRFTQLREEPLFLDTVLTWPHYRLGLRVPDFAKKLAWTATRLKTLTATSSYERKTVYSSHPFQSLPDEWQDSWLYRPILRLSAVTPKGIGIDNAINFGIEKTMRRDKVPVIIEPGWPYGNPNATYFYEQPWVRTAWEQDRKLTIGDAFSVSYDLKTKRGIQLWKWYVRLENDIRLRFTTDYEYLRLENKRRDIIGGNAWNPIRDSLIYNADEGSYFKLKLKREIDPNDNQGSCENSPEFGCQTWPVRVWDPVFEDDVRFRIPQRMHTLKIRPNAEYDFSNKISSGAFFEYTYTREEPDSGDSDHVISKHTIWFEIWLKVRFN